MAQVTWRIRGKILLEHKNEVIANAFPSRVPLKGVKVKVSAREKLLGVWGPFNSWDEVSTDVSGFFEVRREKDQSDRQFKIEVLFKDDSLKLYPDNNGILSTITESLTDMGGPIVDLLDGGLQQALEQTSRLAFDVKWFKILDEDKNNRDHKAGTVDFGDFVFNSDTGQDLHDSIAVKHALAWFVVKEAFGVLNSFGKYRQFTDKTVAIKYPHDNPLIGDSVEAPYTDPYNYVIFIIRNSKEDWFTVDTLLHELMHVWAFQHCTGEKSMAWQLLIHGSTHGNIQDQSFVAFHEGFAEWAKNRLIHIIFKWNNNEYITPYSRKFLRRMDVKNMQMVDKSEYAWISLFNLLITPNLQFLDINSKSDFAEKLDVIALSKNQICSSPSLAFEDILSVFCAHEAKGYKNILDKSEMNLNSFLKRTADIFDNMRESHIEVIKNLLDPSQTSTAASIVCPVPTATPVTNIPDKDYTPPRDLKEPPIRRKI